MPYGYGSPCGTTWFVEHTQLGDLRQSGGRIHVNRDDLLEHVGALTTVSQSPICYARSSRPFGLKKCRFRRVLQEFEINVGTSVMKVYDNDTFKK